MLNCPLGMIELGMTQVELSITANGEQAAVPLLWKLGRDFNVQVNILRASVDTDAAWAQIELMGPVEDIQRATAWLMTTGAHVEASQRAVGV